VARRRDLPVEEGKQQGPDVRSIDVGVGHQDDLVITKLVDIKVVLADPRAERGYERLDLAVAEHLVEPRLLDIQNLSLEGQDGLVLPVASLLSRTAGRIALDD